MHTFAENYWILAKIWLDLIYKHFITPTNSSVIQAVNSIDDIKLVVKDFAQQASTGLYEALIWY